MADKELLPVFQDAKETLCKYDYYIHTPKRILHLTNTEEKIPHLMGLQYIGAEKFTGDSGAYLIKKERIKRKSIEVMTRKLYHKESLRTSIQSMIYGKIDHIDQIKEMFSNASVLYLYDTKKNPESEFKTDYLMVYQTTKQVFQLGLIKSKIKEKNLCHCNSFMVTYTSNDDYDQYYRNLQNRYEILKIVREELLKMILRLNIKFGKYHTIDMLNDSETLSNQCRNPRDKNLVNDFLKLWEESKNN